MNNHSENHLAVKLVRDIQQIPFRMGLDGDPHKLTGEQAGNCLRKSLFLAHKLPDHGFEVVGFEATPFDWRDLPIPRDIVGKLKDPTDTHVALHVTQPPHPDVMRLDIAFDPSMSRLGFPIYEWDGTASMPIAVQPTGPSVMQSAAFLEPRVALSTLRTTIEKALGHERPKPFSDAFNAWLARGK